MVGKRFDGKGMYLAGPNGVPLFRIKYRFDGDENTYSIGAYGTGADEFTLAKARQERSKVREWLNAGLDPNIEKKAGRARVGKLQGETFGTLAREWHAVKSPSWSPDHADKRLRLIEQDLLPTLGAIPPADLQSSPETALAVLQRIESRGSHEVASKARIVGSMICRYGIITGRMQHDPFAHLGAALKRPPVEHRATIAGAEMPKLFEAIATVPAEINTKLACYWLILTATRTVEMRFATWGEIDGLRWRIPAERMKMKLEHVVPLSTQAQQVLRTAKPLRTSDATDALLFPGFSKSGALSENALLALLARAGFYGRQTPHGFRASFSTWAHEIHEADPDVIEACLAHVKGGVRGIYNRSSYLSRRLELLQAWADQCTDWGLKLP